LPLPNPAQFAPSFSSSASIVKGTNADIFSSDTVVRGFGDTYLAKASSDSTALAAKANLQKLNGLKINIIV